MGLSLTKLNGIQREYILFNCVYQFSGYYKGYHRMLHPPIFITLYSILLQYPLHHEVLVAFSAVVFSVVKTPILDKRRHSIIVDSWNARDTDRRIKYKFVTCKTALPHRSACNSMQESEKQHLVLFHRLHFHKKSPIISGSKTDSIKRQTPNSSALSRE